MRELDHGEAAQIAHHGQDMLVHGICMEQVILHLADDLAKRGQVASENGILVHAPQLVNHAPRLLQNPQKQLAVARIAAEAGIDAEAGSPERAQRRRAHAF